MAFFSSFILAWKEVYADKRYYAVTLGSTLVLVALNALVRNYKIVFNHFSLALIAALFLGLFTSFTFSALVMLFLLSFLGGVIISFSIYLLQRQRLMQATAGTPGVMLAILAPACPSCALGLLSIFGVSGILTFLPLKGVEFGLLSFVFSVGTIIYLSKKIISTSCEQRKDRTKR